MLFLPSCCASSSSWWSPSLSFCFFVLLHACRGLLHSPNSSWFFLVAVFLLRGCDSSSSTTSCAVVVLLLSFFFLHFLCRCGSSSSSSLCCFIPLVFLILPLWVFDVVDIGLMLLFEEMSPTKMTFFLEKHHMDHQSV